MGVGEEGGVCQRNPIYSEHLFPHTHVLNYKSGSLHVPMPPAWRLFRLSSVLTIAVSHRIRGPWLVLRSCTAKSLKIFVFKGQALVVGREEKKVMSHSANFLPWIPLRLFNDFLDSGVHPKELFYALTAAGLQRCLDFADSIFCIHKISQRRLTLRFFGHQPHTASRQPTAIPRRLSNSIVVSYHVALPRLVERRACVDQAIRL